MIDLDPILSSVLLLPGCASFNSSPGTEVRDLKLPGEWRETEPSGMFGRQSAS